MSQFDFPRINFHGTALLDTATANNGNYEPALTMFDQERSMPFLPPRCYLQGNNCTPPPGVSVLKDENGNSYVPITPITAENYQAWASTPLGSYDADSAYVDFYKCMIVNPNGPQYLYGITPGYWNFYGDLSMTTKAVKVTGITVPTASSGIVTYTPENQAGCPANLAEMFGAELSFNDNYFEPGSGTTAYLCDVDSMGQMCTQIFYGTAGLYKTDEGGNTTFFTGKPVKATARWMNLTRVLNWANLIPMGGSASFYSMIKLAPGSQIAQVFEQYTGGPVDSVFMKLLVHEVYEVRKPDYSLLPNVSINTQAGTQVSIPKNPATVSITVSITPWKTGDMKTTSLSRIMKNAVPLNIDSTGLGIPNPVPKGGSAGIGIPAAVNMAPVHFLISNKYNIISLDLINAINEYGVNYGTLPEFAGIGDIPPFNNFINYNYGEFSLVFSPANGSPFVIGAINYDSNYNMAQFLAAGGMVDMPIANSDYTTGSFSLTLNNNPVFVEDDVFITTDQQGIYADQNQEPANLYLVDGLPTIPCTLRVLYRGVPVSQSNPVNVTMQNINLVTNGIINTLNVPVYDGMQLVFPVSADGCFTYAFVYNQNYLLQNNFSNFFNFVMGASMVILRVLSAQPQLSKFINGEQAITWNDVFDNVLVLYKTLYPVMDIILPIEEATWSDPNIQATMLQLTSLSNWNLPLYMPVTRDLTAPQRQLLNLWVSQSNLKKS